VQFCCFLSLLVVSMIETKGNSYSRALLFLICPIKVPVRVSSVFMALNCGTHCLWILERQQLDTRCSVAGRLLFFSPSLFVKWEPAGRWRDCRVTEALPPPSSPICWPATVTSCARWNSTTTPTVSRWTVSHPSSSSFRTTSCPTSCSPSLAGWGPPAPSLPSLCFYASLCIQTNVIMEGWNI